LKTHFTPRRLLVTALVSLIATIGVTVPIASTASAWPWDPHVALNGRVTCSPYLGTTPTNLLVVGSNGERGYASLTGTGITRSYRFDFYRVVGNVGVNVNWSCNGIGRSSSFTISRPLVNIYYTRNLCGYLICLI
jgi:hypothetical protein